MKHYSEKTKATLKEKARRTEYDNRYGRMPRNEPIRTTSSTTLLTPTGGPAYYCAECRKRTQSRIELVWVDGRGFCASCAEHKIEHSVWKLRVTSDEDIAQRSPTFAAKSAEDEVLEIKPEAYIMCARSIRTVVRPRTPADPPALVQYVILSSDEYTSEAAWKSALKKLSSKEQ